MNIIETIPSAVAAAANLFNENPDVAEQEAIINAQYVEDVTKQKTIRSTGATSNTERTKQRIAAQEQVILDAHIERFTIAKDGVLTSSKQSTLDILTLARVVFDFSEADVKSKNKKKEFRERCGLLSASKHTQFKKIGSVSRVLGEHAGAIPTGWVSLYAIADYLDKEAKEEKSDDNPNPVLNEEKARELLRGLFGEHTIMVTDKDGDEVRETSTFDAISNQLEVRKIVNTKLGKVNKSSKSGPDAPGVLCAIDLSQVADWKELEAFRVALGVVVDDFPFFTSAEFNRTLSSQVKTNKKLRRPGPGVVVSDA